MSVFDAVQPYHSRILLHEEHIFFVATREDEILFKEFTLKTLNTYLLNFGFEIDNREDIYNFFSVVEVFYNDDKKIHCMRVQYNDAEKFYVPLEAVNDSNFVNIYAVLNSHMQNEIDWFTNKYDEFYEHVRSRIDQVLSVWQENKHAINDATKWSKHFGDGYSKDDFLQNMFWWQKRNEFLEEKKRKKVFNQAREINARNNELNKRPAGLMLERQVENKTPKV